MRRFGLEIQSCKNETAIKGHDMFKQNIEVFRFAG
jgi:hypothetical protein